MPDTDLLTHIVTNGMEIYEGVWLYPFHGHVPGTPDLFHTKCEQHPEFAACAAYGVAYDAVHEHYKTKH